MIPIGTRVKFNVDHAGTWYGPFPALQLATILDGYRSRDTYVYDLDLDVALGVNGDLGTRVTCGPDAFTVLEPANQEISDGTRVQFKLEAPKLWPSSERFPALQFGRITNSHSGHYVIELDDGEIVFCGNDAFVIAKPQRVQVQPRAAVVPIIAQPGMKPLRKFLDGLRSSSLFNVSSGYVDAWPEEMRHEGQSGALPPVANSTIYGRAARIIADLHGAYGAGVSCEMGYREEGENVAGDPAHFYIRLTEEATRGYAGGPSMMGVTFFDNHVTDWRESCAGRPSVTGGSGHGYGAQLVAVDTVRVWLHNHGGKR